MPSIGLPKVIIIGAGFGGLHAAKHLAKMPVEVLLIDRHNFHTFTPLIYQVATCALDPSEVARPVRSIFSNNPRFRFMLGTVTQIDSAARHVSIETADGVRQESYSYLIVAGGAVPTYFDHPEFADHAFELSTLANAVDLRNHILKAFERAAWTDDPALRAALTTIVVVGGGPTGLESAGAVYELYNHVLSREYAAADLKARVILVEMRDHLLAPYPEGLQEAALKQLQSLGVEVELGRKVEEVGAEHIRLDDGRLIPTHTLIWSAGVKASPLAEMLGVKLAAQGRVPVKPTMEVEGLERVFVVGDMAYMLNPDGQPHPTLIPVAIQQSKVAAENIRRMIGDNALTEFRYKDRGIMATIGRSRAVAYIYNRLALRGFIAWIAWLFLHLVALIGFRNRLSVLSNWTWNYFTYDRSVRLILDRSVSKTETEREMA